MATITEYSVSISKMIEHKINKCKQGKKIKDAVVISATILSDYSNDDEEFKSLIKKTLKKMKKKKKKKKTEKKLYPKTCDESVNEVKIGASNSNKDESIIPTPNVNVYEDDKELALLKSKRKKFNLKNNNLENNIAVHTEKRHNGQINECYVPLTDLKEEIIKTHKPYKDQENNKKKNSKAVARAVRSSTNNLKKIKQPAINKENLKKPFTCDVCGAKFSQKHHIVRHCKIHTGEKPYNCYVCGMLFRDQSNLRNHLYTHTGEKRFKCTHCGKKFKKNDNLSVHCRTHSLERPYYNCTLCEKFFTTNGNLTRHTLKKH